MIDKINGNDSYDFHGRNSTNKRKNPAVRAYENTPGAGEAGKKRAQRPAQNGRAPADQTESGVILDLSGKGAGKKKAGSAASRKKDASWADALRRLITPVVKWLKDFWESDRSAEQKAEAPDAGTMETEASGAAAAGEEALGVETAGEEALRAGTAGEETFSAETAGEEALRAETAELDAFAAEMAEMHASDTGSLPPLDGLGEPEELKAMADAAVKSGDLQRIEQFVTRNGTKRLAHNSDLLTYYDRRGKFVEMDETEKYRVLFGDKNVLKL